MHLQAFADLSPQRAREFIVRNRNVLRAVRTAPFPTIAAINGHCLGTGLGLALASDIRIAEVWQNMTLSEGIDKSVEVFSSVFASAETYEQIERHRRAIGRRPAPDQ